MFKLAWRNIWRNRRRTLLTVLSVAGGVGGLMFMQSFSLTFQKRYVENAISFFTGDLRIMSTSVRDTRLPDQDIEDPKPIEQAIASESGVSKWAERVIFTGLVGSARASIGVTVFGVQPDREGPVNEVLSRVVEGSSTPVPGNSVLIGDLLAKDLGVKLGEKIVLIGQAVNGELGAEPFRVVGLFKTGSVLFDSKLVIAPIKPIQDMLYKGDQVTDFIMRVRDIEKVDQIKASLASKLARRGDVQTLAWHDIDKEVLATRRWLNWIYHVGLTVLVVMETLGVLNAILMSILERIREFGVLKAIGAQSTSLFGLVIAECTFIGLLGCALGASAGSLAIAVYHKIGLVIPIGESMAYTTPFDDVLYLTFFWKDHSFAIGATFLGCVLAGLVPAYRVYKFQVSEALRYL